MPKLQDLNVTQAEFAFLVETSTRTIRNKISEGLPSLGRRGLHFVTAFKWWQENMIGAGDSESLTDLKKEKMRIENELKNIELLIKKGELLPRQAIVDHNVRVIIDAKHRFLQLNRTLPPRLARVEPREQGTVIKKAVREILDGLHRGILSGAKGR